MKTQDSSERIAINIKNYLYGVGLLIGTVDTLKKMTWFIERSSALRTISRTLTNVQFIDELRGLEIQEQSKTDRENFYDDEGDHSYIIDEVKRSIVQTKLARGQAFEADWEARKIGSQTPYARMDIIGEKIKQGSSLWNDVIDDISFIEDPNDRLMLLCELAEAAIKAQHADSARFFKLVHDAVKQAIVPDDWNTDPSPITHPLAPLVSLYGTAHRHDDCIELLKKLSQPARDVLISHAIDIWQVSGMDMKKLLAHTDEIVHRLEKVSVLCRIAYYITTDHPDSAHEILLRAEQLLDEAHGDPELYDCQREMTAGEIMQVKVELGEEGFIDTDSMDEKERLVSGLLNLELDVVDKALEKGHVRKAKRLADQIMDDTQQAIAYGWIAYEHIKRAQSDRAQRLLTKDLSPRERIRPISELMWRLSQDKADHHFYGHAGTYLSLAAKTAKEDLKDTMDDELRQHYIRILAYAGSRIVTDAKKRLATSNSEQRSNQLQVAFTEALQARHHRYLPKLALLLTPEDRKALLENLKDQERRTAEAAMLACEL